MQTHIQSTRYRTMMTGKIHRARVTDANIDYVGSITIDASLLEQADILPGEQVDVVDVTNGARVTTYAIPGAHGSGEVCVNGAAARLVHAEDIVIIIAYGVLSDVDARTYEPHVVFVDEHNAPCDISNEPGQVPSENAAGTHGGQLHSSGITFEQARSTQQ